MASNAGRAVWELEIFVSLLQLFCDFLRPDVAAVNRRASLRCIQDELGYWRNRLEHAEMSEDVKDAREQIDMLTELEAQHRATPPNWKAMCATWTVGDDVRSQEVVRRG